uniref:Putative myosin light chain binding protein n=1 Tax=Anopheles marajoara TaxID=58244 RepID=A0A2M4C2M9_9DIPT
MHIHPSSPNSSQSEDDAATKIQAGFRGYRVRKQMGRQGPASGTAIGGIANGNGSIGGVGGSSGVAAVGAAIGRNPGGVGGVGAGGAGGSVTVEDKSATKIQANVRGFLVRKKQKVASDAATKIQASFRGFRTRKELKSIKKSDK